MDFKIIIANCISSSKLGEEDIWRISVLLTSKKISIDDLITSLEEELVSPIASQKKRGIEIIEQVLWKYLPNEDFNEVHVKLICCFVLNYISDWACIDGVVGIIKCIFQSQYPELLKRIKIDIRDDEKLMDEYSFSPIIQLEDRDSGREERNLPPGKLVCDGKYVQSYLEISSYHKFDGHFNIQPPQDDEELFKMSLAFYLLTQILYKVSTRQLVYSSRVKIIELFLLIFENQEFHSELERLGPGMVPIVIQHIENEKDPRVLIKAFPLIQNILVSFHDTISKYDIEYMKFKKGNSSTSIDRKNDGYDLYQLYFGRVPELSEEEKLNLISKQNLRVQDETDQVGEDEVTSDFEPLSNKENGILSCLISETLFSYFPLQFQSGFSHNIHFGKVSPKDLKRVYFLAITCSELIQDSLIQAIVEFIDTQGLLENVITNYEELHFKDETEFELFADSNDNFAETPNKPINLSQKDQEILSDSLTLLYMAKYKFDPETINKYISSIFLLMNELLKNTVISSQETYQQLLRTFFFFLKLELGYQKGQQMLNAALNKFIIPKIIFKLNSSHQLDKFAFNILELFILTKNESVIENIMNNFALDNIFNGNSIEKININSKLLTSFYIFVKNDRDKPKSELKKFDSFLFKAKEALKIMESDQEQEKNLKSLDLPKLSLYSVVKCILGEHKDLKGCYLQTLEYHWTAFSSKNELEKSHLIGICSLLMFSNPEESRKFWFNYLYSARTDGFGPVSPRIILEKIVFSLVEEEMAPSNLVENLVRELAIRSVLYKAHEAFSLECWQDINLNVQNILEILDSEKWRNVKLNTGTQIHSGKWVSDILSSVSTVKNQFFVAENKQLFGTLFKRLGALTFKLYRYIFEEEKKTESEDFLMNLKKTFDSSSNIWILLVFINELISYIILERLENNESVTDLLEACSDWLNEKVKEIGEENTQDSEMERLVNSEIEKLVITLLKLSNKAENSVKNKSKGYYKYKGENNTVFSKTLRYNLFNGEGFENEIFDEISKKLTKVSKLNYISELSQENSKEILSDLSSLLYIIGSDLNILVDQNSSENYLQVGKLKFIFNTTRSGTDNLDWIQESCLMSDQAIDNRAILILSSHDNANIGGCTHELVKLRMSNTNQTCPLTPEQHVEPTENHSEEYNSSENIEDLWPEVVPLTGNCYQKIDLRIPRIQEKVIEINKLILKCLSDTFPLNTQKSGGSGLYPLAVIPIISSMCNLNMTKILENFSSRSIRLILLLSLIECTNYRDYETKKLENPELIKLLAERDENSDIVMLDVESKLKEVRRLLNCKQASTKNDIWKCSMQELYVHNLQSLLILMRVLHYAREYKLVIYEKRNQNKHKLDFVFDDIGVYSTLVSNIIENHPNSLVRLISHLIISQVFKFPTVFRTNLKNTVVKSLNKSASKDINKDLRKLSCILKLKILVLNDHI
ncbi:Dos2-interacting transcription regulator of RNA-Pol-II [Cryptosporidium felis]|nr:Dos2-interacting transcription regulator of RNA-Pol-II [Cryptosporidium felis]